ncbi:MAG: hypothetical protein V3U60_09015 [Gammaproteobacteria bacterium]
MFEVGEEGFALGRVQLAISRCLALPTDNGGSRTADRYGQHESFHRLLAKMLDVKSRFLPYRVEQWRGIDLVRFR